MSEPDSPTRGDLHHQHQHQHHHHHQQQQQQQLHQSSPSSQQNAAAAAAADEHDDANNSIIGKVKSRVSSIFPQKLTQWFSPSTTPTATSTTSNGGVGRRRRRNDESEGEAYERADNSDEESNNSAEDDEDASPVSAQPPMKRSRLNVEMTTSNFKETQGFVSSTPTTVVRRRTTHLNLYGKQKEPAYNFTQTTITTNTTRSGGMVTNKNSTVDSADIIEVVPERSVLNTSISSRRSLNIPSTLEGYRNMHDLKRQSVSNMRTLGANAFPSVSTYTPQRSSTTILEEDDNEDADEEQEAPTQTIVVEEVDDDDDIEDVDNEESEEIAKVTSKKQNKFTNGNLGGRSSSVATESGESRSSSVAQAGPSKSGMFSPANRDRAFSSGNGLNFYLHLEGRKSLFSEKNMPGMLNNSTLSLNSLNRRQFNSSIYGSTSALSDSRLLNTSSPFYKGQTTYGGAAAYSKFNRQLNPAVRIAPTLIRPTSSLSTLSSSSNSLAQGNDQSNSTISSTAKRILELINDFSTPLNDAKKMASNIKTPSTLASRAAAGKRFSDADLATSRSVRLSTVRTPYTRPTVTLNPSNSDSKKLLPPLKELQVPSMSQLMQMKKMQNCTERSRQIANKLKPSQPLEQESEYKLPGEDDGAGGDKSSNKHVSKIKNKVTSSSRVSSKNTNVEDEEAPPPVNLPNIAFPFMQSVPKIDIPLKTSGSATTMKDFKFGVPSVESKPTSNFSFGIGNKAPEVEKPTPATSKPAVNFNFGTSSTTVNASNATSSEFKFSSPLNLGYVPSKESLTPINNFKFSSPVMVDKQNEIGKTAPTPFTSVQAPVPQLKTGSVLDALKKPTEKVAPTTKSSATETPTTNATPMSSAGASLFGSQFKRPSNQWECSVCMVPNKETVDACVACTTPRTKPAAAAPAPAPVALSSSNSLVKNTFGDAFKRKSDTWECPSCMVPNKNELNECLACNTKKTGAAGAPATAPATKLSTTDVGFKSLVAKQTAAKWECDACMTRNDVERNKCVCCEQAKPGTQTVSENVPKFSFGSTSASKFTFGFGNAGAKKEDELKAEAVSKTENKTSGFTFGIPATTQAGSTGSTNSPAPSIGFVFGANSFSKSTSPQSAGKDVPDVAKTNASGFKFGVQPEAAPTANTPSAGFTFGAKLDAAKPSVVKFNLPSTTTTASTSAAVTSTSASSTTALFNPKSPSSFGVPQKIEEPKSTPAEPLSKPAGGFVFGAPAPVVSRSAPTSTATTTNSQSLAVKPITFGSNPSSTSDANKTPPKITFGSPATASTTSAVGTSTTSSNFVFGKPAATTSAFTSLSSSSGFAFGGKDQASSSVAPSLFAPQVPSSTSVNSKSTTPAIGTKATASNAVTTQGSLASAAFVFGKPTTTPLFGATPATTSTTATTSLIFPSAAAVSSSPTPTSAVSTTLATTNPAPTTMVSSTPFVFGSGATSNASQPSKPLFGSSPFEAGSAAAPSTNTATSSWATNSFTFGSSKPAEETVKTNTMPAPAFGSPAPIFGQALPLFGSTPAGEAKPTPAAPSAAPSFGAPSSSTLIFGSVNFGGAATPAPTANSSNPTTAATSLFGSNSTSTSTAQQPSANVFGATSSTPIFGSTSFGSSAGAAPAAPTNSSNPTPAPTFGSLGSSSFSSGFGSLAAASSSSASTDGASAPKKAQLAFNFGSSQSSGNGGFAFGSNNNNKPVTESAFKFTASSAPSFNFTGTSESTNATQPFQFGAPTSTPAVFNFGGVEGSNSSGPFQFNAAAPAAATNNIFAPMPIPGSQAASQQARRKMRTTNRRITPR